MTFGFVGYIWAFLCCGLFASVIGATGLVLYAVGRRSRSQGKEPRHVVDVLPLPSADGAEREETDA